MQVAFSDGSMPLALRTLGQCDSHPFKATTLMNAAFSFAPRAAWLNVQEPLPNISVQQSMAHQQPSICGIWYHFSMKQKA